MKTITDVDISGKRVLCRVDFNVPLDSDRKITDDSRIQAVLPTIKYALGKNAKLILASHLGRPGGKHTPEFSLLPVAQHLKSILNKKVTLAPDCIGSETEKIVSAMMPGDIVLLENLRFHPGEQKDDDEFAKQLARLCDVYVNDGFAVSHRSDVSVVKITKFAPVSVAGLLMKNEIDYFKKAMENPQRPLAAIVGGAKVSTKVRAIENMLQQVNKLIIGGAMANTFLKSAGYNVGKSKIEADMIDVAASVMKKAEKKGIKVYLPKDVIVADRFDPDAKTKTVSVNDIPLEWMIMDIGPATSILYAEAINDAKTIIWNGPMGVFEMDKFSRGTFDLAHNVANSNALTIAGGGDTDAAIHKSGTTDRITYISTGGGAFLALLEGKSLPGVAALCKK